MSVAPAEVQRPVLEEDLDRPWITIVWNDPINLMSYVTYVFMTYFKYDRAKAELLMMDVHERGKAVVSMALGRRWSVTLPRCIHMGYGLLCRKTIEA